jgi:uncharacterized protein HemX
LKNNVSFEEENEKSRNLRKQLISIQEQINQAENQLGSKQEELNELKLARSELLRSCLLNEISIPLKGCFCPLFLLKSNMTIVFVS